MDAQVVMVLLGFTVALGFAIVIGLLGVIADTLDLIEKKRRI